MGSAKQMPWERRRRRLLVLSGLLGALFATWLVWRLQVKRAYLEDVAAMRAAGIPTTAAEREEWMEQWPLLPTCPELVACHDAYVYQAAETVQELPRFRRLDHPSALGPELLGVPYPARELNAMRDLVERNGEALRLMREARAAQSAPCRGGVNESVLVVELICSAICLRAEEGNGAEAVAFVLDGVRYAQATEMNERKDPRGLWLSGWDGRVFRAMYSASLRTTFPEPALRAIQQQLETSDWADGQRFTIQVELSWLVSGREGEERSRLRSIGNLITGDMERRVSRSCRSSFSRLAALEEETRQELETNRGWGPGPDIHTRLAWLAMEVLCHHGKTGMLPESLESLGLPASRTVDYCGGGLLKYRVEGNRFTVYSVGRDLKDDGGDGKRDVAVSMGVGTVAGCVGAVPHLASLRSQRM